MTDSSLPPSRPPLQVRPWRLRDTDTGALKVFLKLLTSRLQAEWQLSDNGPIDLLVMPADTVEEPAGSDVPGIVRLRIAIDAAQAAQSPAPVLVRPLQFEDVAALLQAVEPDLIATSGLRRTAEPPPPKAAPDTPASTPAAEQAPAAQDVDVEHEPVSEAVPTMALVSDAAPPAQPALALMPHARVKLKRWPDPELLQGRRDHQRLASQITTTALERDDLLSLSSLPAVEVDAFLEAMHRADLLDVLPPQAAAAVDADDPALADVEPVPGSLFGLIRRRLGIGH